MSDGEDVWHPVVYFEKLRDTESGRTLWSCNGEGAQTPERSRGGGRYAQPAETDSEAVGTPCLFA